MSVFRDLRREFHLELIANETLSVSTYKYEKGKNKGESYLAASNADKSQNFSTAIANIIADKIAKGLKQEVHHVKSKPQAQTLGNHFEEACKNFLARSFEQLGHLRPGNWVVEKVSSRSGNIIGRFEQYAHLTQLQRLANEHSELRNFLGDGYTIAPDVAVIRKPEPDTVINLKSNLVDEDTSLQASLRADRIKANDCVPELLHASVSCKFTMRSDRAQNTRTEALNLIRARKGRVPHIVAITAEPTPSRLASLAEGTGDIDCVYHFALYELLEALTEMVDEDPKLDANLEQLKSMIDGKRLKDISDLPLDLAV
ncbi:NgoMIV family type II restriction endonuclease [Pseudoalteromonas sp. T1lg75]|uniref:NgoMIV family type II restriction endonuclease n=1 Tax=Pseudoalteromonas sp. T1lg75 TaxID=2077102 RepID=UPI000CF6F3A7|nr:NgoMIV family type II restriction endonuclease [Pseudoalteromonas sp. T1lg75]